MKKISFILCALLVDGSIFAAPTNSDSKKAESSKSSSNSDSKKVESSKSSSSLGFGTGKGFIGGEVGVGGVSNLGIGILGGYQYYFKSDWQFSTFRHGVRGIAAVDWTQYSSRIWSGQTYNGLFASVGADWTIDFTPQSKYVWGAYIGLSLGYFKLFGNWTFIDPSSFIWSGNLGGSLTIQEKHRIELSLGSGFSLFALRYMFMF